MSNSSSNRASNLRKAIETLETLREQTESTVFYNDCNSALERCRKKLEQVSDGNSSGGSRTTGSRG